MSINRSPLPCKLAFIHLPPCSPLSLLLSASTLFLPGSHGSSREPCFSPWPPSFFHGQAPLEQAPPAAMASFPLPFFFLKHAAPFPILHSARCKSSLPSPSSKLGAQAPPSHGAERPLPGPTSAKSLSMARMEQPLWLAPLRAFLPGTQKLQQQLLPFSPWPTLRAPAAPPTPHGVLQQTPRSIPAMARDSASSLLACCCVVPHGAC
jgi:hypothetical protein